MPCLYHRGSAVTLGSLRSFVDGGWGGTQQTGIAAREFIIQTPSAACSSSRLAHSIPQPVLHIYCDPHYAATYTTLRWEPLLQLCHCEEMKKNVIIYHRIYTHTHKRTHTSTHHLHKHTESHTHTLCKAVCLSFYTLFQASLFILDEIPDKQDLCSKTVQVVQPKNLKRYRQRGKENGKRHVI